MKPALKFISYLIIFASLPLAAQSPVIFNGGITLDERESAPQTGTKLEFFVASGSFLAAISVTVSDDSGREVVSTVTRGPWLILNLEPGTYRVQAQRNNGDVQGGTINVTGGVEKFSFMFPE